MGMVGFGAGVVVFAGVEGNGSDKEKQRDVRMRFIFDFLVFRSLGLVPKAARTSYIPQFASSPSAPAKPSLCSRHYVRPWAAPRLLPRTSNPPRRSLAKKARVGLGTCSGT